MENLNASFVAGTGVLNAWNLFYYASLAVQSPGLCQ